MLTALKRNEASFRQWANIWWPTVLTVFIYVSTVGFASWALTRMYGDISWSRALIWQGLLYAAWLPFLGCVWGLVRYLGLSLRLLLALYVVTALAAFTHALLCLMIDAHYLSLAFEFESIWRRLPIDILMATAIAASVAAVRGYRLSSEGRRRVAELQASLAEARQEAARTLHLPENPQRLLVSIGSRRVLVEIADIEWVSAAGNYVVVNWNGREGLIRESLTSTTQRLDPSIFVRAHRSTVVNLAKVQSAACLADGGWVVTMESGVDLVVSRTYRDEVLGRLEHN